jgi:hypothetical protein
MVKPAPKVKAKPAVRAKAKPVVKEKKLPALPPLITPKEATKLSRLSKKERVSAELNLKIEKLRKTAGELHITSYSEEDEQRFWGRRTFIPITDDTPAVVACCNEHRETSLRLSVGRKHTTYIPMDGGGLHIKRCTNGQFRHDWSVLVEFTPQQIASRYLSSMAASYYISEQARTHLEEIVKHGAILSTTQEHTEMSDTTKKSKTKAATKAPAKGKTSASAAAKSSPAKTVKASAAKGTVMPATSGKAKSDNAVKRYAGLKVKALVKVADVTAREGTWTRAMILAGISNPTTDAGQAVIDKSKEWAGRPVNYSWLMKFGYVSVEGYEGY